jgi:hypothetical protein
MQMNTDPFAAVVVTPSPTLGYSWVFLGIFQITTTLLINHSPNQPAVQPLGILGCISKTNNSPNQPFSQSTCVTLGYSWVFIKTPTTHPINYSSHQPFSQSAA